jgi:hypothetical protein
MMQVSWNIYKKRGEIKDIAAKSKYFDFFFFQYSIRYLMYSILNLFIILYSKYPKTYEI